METSKPTKQRVREWIHNQVKQKTPIPSAEQIRRELGWPLLEAERERRDKERTRR